MVFYHFFASYSSDDTKYHPSIPGLSLWDRIIFASMKKALIQLHIAVFLAGFTAILGKLIKLNEGLLVWYRLLITVLTLAVLLYVKKKLVKISVKDALKFLGVGTIVAIHWVSFYGSVKYANVSVA